MFRRGVGRIIRHADKASSGRHVDDIAAALDQMGHGGAAHLIDAGQIHGHDTVPTGTIDIFETAEVQHASDVAEDV